MGLWWALRKKGARLKRLLGVVVCIAVFYGLFRYDGSADGSAFPSLAWRWQKKDLAAGTPQHRWQSHSSRSRSGGCGGHATLPGRPKGDGVLEEPEWQTDWKAHPPREVWRMQDRRWLVRLRGGG
jgi:outer membrane protein assembly factor BamB